MNLKHFFIHGLECEYQGLKLRWYMIIGLTLWLSAICGAAKLAEVV